jgi:hypothetical protein
MPGGNALEACLIEVGVGSDEMKVNQGAKFSIIGTAPESVFPKLLTVMM